MNLRERNKKPATKGSKRPRGETSSQPEPNFNLLPGNRYLFRDDEAHRMFLRFTKRGLSGCYYFDPKGKIPTRYLTKINNWINHFLLTELATIPDTYSDHTTRLFYANLRFHNMDDATSYFHGRIIDVSFRKLASLLSMRNAGHSIYPHKSWPWHEDHETCQESAFDYRKWFGFGTRKGLYVTDLPALHRVTHLLVNNILTPKSKTKTNIENGGLFYMRHMIAMDEIELNIPYVLISHMHKAHSNSKDSLPYGNLIHLILKNQGIEDPLHGVPEDEHKQPKNILDYFSDWTKTDGEMLVPNPSDPRNAYLIAEGAAPNQYHPLGEEAPIPVESDPEPEPAPQAASTSQAGNLDQIMAYLTNQFQSINQTLHQYSTDANDRHSTLITRLDRYETEAKQRFDQFGNQLDGYGQQLSSFQEEMRSGFRRVDDSIERCHHTVNQFWEDIRGPSTSQGGKGDDSDDGDE